MKILLIALTTLISILNSQNTLADISSITDNQRPVITQEQRIEGLKKIIKELPDYNNPEEIKEYIKKRIPHILNTTMTKEELSTPSSISIVDTQALKKRNQKTLSDYEKIYQNSLQKLGNISDTLNKDTKIEGKFYQLVNPIEKSQAPVIDFPHVKVKLSDTKEILAPAEEHFPYVLTTIYIEPTGLLHVTEEFIFISTNIGFPEGFFRILPKYNYSRNGDHRRIDIKLDSVTINGETYPYKISEIGNYLYIKPQQTLNLPAGIYTYHFNYTIDRAVWYYKNFDELYWNITASTVKHVVGSANAVVVLPNGRSFIAQNAIVKQKNNLDEKRVTISKLAENSLAFADTLPLDVGEDIHLYLTMEKGTLLEPDTNKKYFWFIQDYGANIFAILTLLALLLSYKISHNQLLQNKDKRNIYIKKAPAFYRYINQNVFDKNSFGAELLNLCSKNILELKKQNQTAVLIKKTDNLTNLTKQEKTLINKLYPNSETTLVASSESSLKIKRAYNYLKQKVLSQYFKLKLRLNSLYLIFGITMLIIGEYFAAIIAVNPTNTFLTILICTLLMFIGLVVFQKKFNCRALNIISKLITSIYLLFVAGWLAIYTTKIYAVIILISCLTIINYYILFSRRNGLLRNKIKETEEYKSYLQKNPEFTQLDKDFDVKLPYILTFGLEKKYPENTSLELINYFMELTPEVLEKE